MNVDFDTLGFALVIFKGLAVVVGLAVFFVALMRGQVSIAWMRKHLPWWP
jgi:hypothetical protein